MVLKSVNVYKKINVHMSIFKDKIIPSFFPSKSSPSKTELADQPIVEQSSNSNDLHLTEDNSITSYIDERSQLLTSKVFKAINPLRRRVNKPKTIAENEDLMIEFAYVRNLIEENNLQNSDERIPQILNEVSKHITSIRWKIEEIHEDFLIAQRYEKLVQESSLSQSQTDEVGRKLIKNAERRRKRKADKKPKDRHQKAAGVIQFKDKHISESDLERILKEITKLIESVNQNNVEYSTQQGSTAHKRHYIEVENIDYRLTTQSHGSFGKTLKKSLLVRSLKESYAYKKGILTDEIINQAINIV